MGGIIGPDGGKYHPASDKLALTAARQSPHMACCRLGLSKKGAAAASTHEQAAWSEKSAPSAFVAIMDAMMRSKSDPVEGAGWQNMFDPGGLRPSATSPSCSVLMLPSMADPTPSRTIKALADVLSNQAFILTGRPPPHAVLSFCACCSHPIL